MKIKTDCTKSYMSGIEALQDLGYNHIGIIEMNNSFKIVRRQLLEKNGVRFYYKGMDHYNTTIYNVSIEKVSKINGWYNEEEF